MTGGGAESAGPAPFYTRNIPVSSNEDLLDVIATAPRRSVIVLSDDGPYQLGGRAWSFRAPAPIVNADLTIKAEAGVRPVLKFASDARLADRPPLSLLQFVGGHVTIDGVVFDLDVALPDEPVASIRIKEAELTLRGCLFRRSNSLDGRNVAALSIQGVQNTGTFSDRPPSVFVDRCHFDGGQTAVLAVGPVDLALRDCTIGPGQPAIWFDNPRSNSAVPGELRLSHSSFLAGTGPVFRFDGSQVRAWLDDCVVASAGRSSATLVLVDNARDLIWRGRSNVYAGIAIFEAFSGLGEHQESIVDFSRWMESPTDNQELGSRLVATSVWDVADPLQGLATETDNPTRVFLVNRALAQGPRAVHARARSAPCSRTRASRCVPRAAPTKGFQTLLANRTAPWRANNGGRQRPQAVKRARRQLRCRSPRRPTWQSLPLMTTHRNFRRCRR